MGNIKKTALVLMAVAVMAVVVITAYSLRQRVDPRGWAEENAVVPTSPASSPSPSPAPPVDFDGNGKVDDADRQVFVRMMEENDTGADLDGSGEVNSLDLNIFLKWFEEQANDNE